MLKISQKLSEVKLPGQKVVLQLQIMRLFWQLVNHPGDTSLVFKLADLLNIEARKLDPQELSKYLRAQPHYQQMFEEYYLAPDYKVSDLVGCRPGTLGQAYYKHMTDNGFTPDFYPPVEVVDDFTYLMLRGRQTHDLWHVVTGYGTDVVGEISLQAFYLGQNKDDLLATLLISAGAAHAALIERRIMTALVGGIGEGFNRGLAAKTFYAVKWEEMWDYPLADLRAELGVREQSAGARGQLAGVN